MHADVAQVRMLLCSPDARVRTVTARSVCPCHGSYELLHALRDELTLLAEIDPDKNVRAAASHALREGMELNIAEEAKWSRKCDSDVRQEHRDRKRAVRKEVALRRARRRAIAR